MKVQVSHTYHSKETRVRYLILYGDISADEYAALPLKDRVDLLLLAGHEISQMNNDNYRHMINLL